MAKNESSIKIQRFVSTTGKNQYLLTSAGEAAAIDVSEAHDEVGTMLENMGVGLKYLLVTHAHKLHLQALPALKNKYGGTFCLHEYEYELLKESDAALEPDRFIKDEEKLQRGSNNDGRRRLGAVPAVGLK